MKWLFHNSGLCEAAFNMAFDEALLESMPRLNAPVLRFYGWSEAAATFGYFQKVAEVEAVTSLRPLIRRTTGGGVVPHDADWTYCLAFPATHGWYQLRAEESYKRMHEWISSAFSKLNIKTELATCCKRSMPGQCFEGYEKHDLLWCGRKIAGAAQRRNRNGLLIQGSIQPPAIAVSRDDWQMAMCSVVRVDWGGDWQELVIDTPLINRVIELVRTKYSQAEYNRKR